MLKATDPHHLEDYKPKLIDPQSKLPDGARKAKCLPLTVHRPFPVVGSGLVARNSVRQYTAQRSPAPSARPVGTIDCPPEPLKMD